MGTEPEAGFNCLGRRRTQSNSMCAVGRRGRRLCLARLETTDSGSVSSAAQAYSGLRSGSKHSSFAGENVCPRMVR
jgi:hypothetical protein